MAHKKYLLFDLLIAELIDFGLDHFTPGEVKARLRHQTHLIDDQPNKQVTPPAQHALIWFTMRLEMGPGGQRGADKAANILAHSSRHTPEAIRRRYERAEAFLKTHPRSADEWERMLAEVFAQPEHLRVKSRDDAILHVAKAQRSVPDW